MVLGFKSKEIKKSAENEFLAKFIAPDALIPLKTEKVKFQMAVPDLKNLLFEEINY